MEEATVSLLLNAAMILLLNAAMFLHADADPRERPLLVPAASGVPTVGASEILPMLLWFPMGWLAGQHYLTNIPCWANEFH